MRLAFAIVCLISIMSLSTLPTYAGAWAAVSYCKTTGNIGYSYRGRDETTARNYATAACQLGVVEREGKSKDLARSCCQVIEATNSRCFVVSTSLDSRKSVFVARHKNKYKAVTQSMRACMKVGKFCKMLVIACAGDRRGQKEDEAGIGYGVGRTFPTGELR